MIDLTGVVIVVDRSQPSYLRHAAGELQGYVEEITGADVQVRTSVNVGSGTVIAIGPGIARQVVSDLPRNNLGEEGFVIRSVVKDGRSYLVVCGGSAKGTKHGVYELMTMIRSRGKTAYVEGPVDLTSKPSFALRGIHLNGWPFNYPYTFRKWPERDWERYIDILSAQHVNLFFIWPFMEMIPLPLSKQDEDYLREFRRVVDYAQKEHGMEVWMMQSANRVANSNCGVEDPRDRPYWKSDVQVDMNPADPEQFRKIMDSREALYRIVNNVDGVVTIDSDPGGWPGAPVSDWVKILNGCRKLLDKHNVHGSKAKLIAWLHLGWGRTGPVDFELPEGEIIKAIHTGCPEPTMFAAGWLPILSMCKEEGVIGRTVALPYSTIEGEPSYPATGLHFDKIKGILDSMSAFRQECAGAIGNAQTPLLQFPNVHFFLSTLWDHTYCGRGQEASLLELAALLYPENQALIANCFAALRSTDASRIEALAARLDTLVTQDKLGRPGVLARKLFPDRGIVARSLLAQLKFRAAQERVFSRVTMESSLPNDRGLITACLEAYLAWDHEHGWHEYWDKTQGWAHGWPLGRMSEDARFGRLISVLKQKLHDESGVDSLFADVAGRLNDSYGEESVTKFGIEPFKTAIRNARITLAQTATATASVVPKPDQYPPSAAVDGSLTTLYWPGALVTDNAEWLQLTWKDPQTIRKVVVHFLKHASMVGRTIHLQAVVAGFHPGQDETWQDFATTVIPDDASAAHSIATFELPSPVTLDRLRVVNLLDLYEVEVYSSESGA